MELAQTGPLIYEVNLSVKPAIVDEFDVWLRGHVSDMLALPGFTSAEIFSADESADAHKRVVQYRLRDRQALEQYLADHAPRMREDGIKRFGDDFSAQRRILEAGFPAGSTQVCANCGSTLVADYCANCGQEDKDYHISFWRLTHDFMGDNFNFDSRLIRSLKPLFFKPGQLTVEYMNGWRARHIPPLRLYLFVSIVFFALLAVGMDKNINLMPKETSGTQEEVGKDVLQNLEEKGITVAVPTVEKEASGSGTLKSPSEENTWEDYIEAKVMHYRNNWSKGQLVEELLNKLPITMFLVLPLYAFLLKLLYLFGRRYYMEHLIFAFHVHAFTFMVFIGLEIWSNWLSLWLGLEMNGWIITAIVLWLMLYPWFALRRTYGQGWWMTTLKYLALGTLYFFVLTAAIAAALVAAVLI
ncbi:MAG TPA: DUF4286 family protein [Gammaproteobacteria bacterium]|nr:DUF4286 family protein [Gammaproteobacteria bacterium]